MTQVAILIPTPGDALCADDVSWSAFGELLAAAADLLSDALGAAAMAPLRSLAGTPMADDPVRRLLIEQTLDRLSARNRR